ncbi:metal-dependent hydrolase [Salisediminibacterium halotolerans]|uniref:UPF0173 metal-dependent hydrolase SAMN05444126_11818 n=1 Tax=Salisediminibacterium halotolerans TaxID=517425 RepID=A0A1H9V6B7_9BACI|nr:metal-dependent hydrolase [Salisediminibacterium haloalkalitolerans]SES17091.1 L-ascorbate metabolism protein UlaG, beta-lactamase superfamily [Salisediminibacterium haloalkalitolerans]
MKLSFHGHSVVKVITNGQTILIDPYLTGNGATDLNAQEEKPDVILLTHGHNDHVGDTVELAKKSGALVVAPFELATYLGWQGVDTHPMHIGGSHTFDFGTVKLTQAFHGSSYTEADNEKIVYTGMPAGILLMAEGQTVFHAGDTALFSDMKMYGEQHKIDLAFLPIGDNFTMGPDDALLAAKWLQAKKVVPIHYDTFPLIEQDGEAFAAKVNPGDGIPMKAGDEIEL